MVLCFVSPGFTITEDEALNFIVSLIRVPILWIVQLISAKFQGRNRQNNSNRRKGVAGGSDACLAPDFLRKIHS
jgi:hypothetical protein